MYVCWLTVTKYRKKTSHNLSVKKGTTTTNKFQEKKQLVVFFKHLGGDINYGRGGVKIGRNLPAKFCDPSLSSGPEIL